MRGGSAGLGVAAVLAAATLGAVASPAAAAAAPSPAVAAARLQGRFLMSGRITQAAGIPGERRGQRVRRTWAFSSTCAAGACTTVALLRARVGGTDSVTLVRKAAGRYSGTGSFYVPVRCGTRVIRRGEQARFTVTVRVTGTQVTPTGVIARTLTASYRGLPRRNLTRCVAVAGHDAATYSGTLQA